MVVKKKSSGLPDLDDDFDMDFGSADDDMGFDTDLSLPSDDEEPSSSKQEGSLEKLASNVVSSLIKEGIPPTPTNFQAYFDRLLEELPDAAQEEIGSMIDLEDSNSDEQAIALEEKIKGAFVGVKSLLQTSSNLYKNMTLMSRILSKRQSELSSVKDPALKSVVKAIQGDVGKLSTILDKQITSMKQNYQETAGIVKEVEQGSIFDQQFGVYNKRYLLTRLDLEASQITQFKHSSSLVTVTLTKEIRDIVPTSKAILLMEKTVARLLMKTSRRSDIVAHYSEGIFAMLLKHTDLTSADHASGRLVKLVESTNFFLGEKEVVLGVNIGIAKVTPDRSSEETLLATISAMNEVNRNPNKSVLVYEKDID